MSAHAERSSSARALGALGWVVRTLSWAAVGLGVVGISVLVVVPRVLGWVPLTVLSGSMEPTIPVGSQVVVQPLTSQADVRRLEVGDVITFTPGRGESLVTHRIADVNQDVSGDLRLTTRGDANNVADAWRITADQVRGQVRYHVPYAGRVAALMSTSAKDTSATVIAVGLFGFAAVQLLLAARPSGRRARPTMGA